jgi:hypothetical protein
MATRYMTEGQLKDWVYRLLDSFRADERPSVRVVSKLLKISNLHDRRQKIEDVIKQYENGDISDLLA